MQLTANFLFRHSPSNRHAENPLAIRALVERWPRAVKPHACRHLLFFGLLIAGMNEPRRLFSGTHLSARVTGLSVCPPLQIVCLHQSY